MIKIVTKQLSNFSDCVFLKIFPADELETKNSSKRECRERCKNIETQSQKHNDSINENTNKCDPCAVAW